MISTEFCVFFTFLSCFMHSYSFPLFLKTFGNLNSASFYFNTINNAIGFFPFVSFFVVVVTANYCRLWGTHNKRVHLQMCFKVGVLKNFTIFKGKRMCWTLLKACNFIRDRIQHRCFLWILKKIKNSFLIKTPPMAVSAII